MVYLIHLETKLSHAGHYIGYSADDKFSARIHHHEKNTGSAFLRAVNKAGIKWKVVRQWPNEDGNFERKLKNRKNASQLCPVCNPKK
jgi:predicted GIY-YIG superfamily endonuclease